MPRTKRTKPAGAESETHTKSDVIDQLDYFRDKKCPLPEASKVYIWLEHIAVTLEDYDQAGIVWTEPGGQCSENAQVAIAEYKDLELALYDAGTRLGSLPASDQTRQVQVALMTIDSALMDSDCPAESALWDGHEDAAIAVIRGAFQRAYEQAGHGLRWMASEWAVNATEGSPTDLITFASACDAYCVARPTLQRHVDAKDLKSYRQGKGPHRVSESEVARRWPRRNSR